VPSASYKFPTELIREGAICINFSSDKNFDNAAVKERAAIYVPAIGKVTIAMLLRNLYCPGSISLTLDCAYTITDERMKRTRRSQPTDR
jgi:hypothetical protein